MPKERIAPRLKSLIVQINTLKPDPANLRIHEDRSVEAIAASLERFGQQRPVVVDALGIVIAGNGVLEAARKLGWKRLAAVRSDLQGAERIGYAIADNRTAELSSWDTEGLEASLGEMDSDLRMAAGFTDAELAELLDEQGDRATEDEAPAPLPDAVTRRGDLWLLGEHRLLCGDSTDAGDVGRVMDGQKAALVATDPPYLVDYTGVRVGDRGKDWSKQYREVDVADAQVFFRGLFARVLEVLAERAPLYCWHAHRRCGLIQRIWEELGIIDHQQVVWVKPCPLLGTSLYHFQHEPCMVGWRKGKAPRHDGRHDVSSVWVVPWDPRTSVVSEEGADVWIIDWEGKKRPVGNEHPTQKPVEIFARPMRKHTAAGDVCFEPFSGSGSQLVAAQQTGRRCFAIELEPTFVDVGVRRWQRLTGHAARLDGDGRTWEEMARERGVDLERPPAKNDTCPPDHPEPAAPADARSSPRQARTARSTAGGTSRRGPRPKARRTRAGTGRSGAGSGG